jgi:hypothetical protein
MKKVKFDLKYKEKIINGIAKVFYNDNPVRIICWDRETGDSPGVNPIVGLLKSNCGYSETIVTISENGTLSVPGMGITSNCVYVHVPELPSRLYRVKYCLTTMQCPEALWDKYGYVEDENESWHTNAMRFINNVAPLHITELHNDLKKNGHWTYEDDEDWDFNFHAADELVCVSDAAPYELEIGGIYIIREIDYGKRTVIIKAPNGNCFTISFFDCLDLFTRSYKYEREGKYDFTQMKAFTPVLARTGDHQTWFPHFFESYHPQNHGGEFYMLDDQHTLYRYSQCVPYEGNEHLLKTQDPIPPYYDIR